MSNGWVLGLALAGVAMNSPTQVAQVAQAQQIPRAQQVSPSPLAAAAPATAAATATPAEDLVRLSNWLAGEWNNNEQVWQQKIDAADPKVLRKEAALAHLHQIFLPVQAPLLGAHVFYLQQSRGDDLQQLRSQRVLRLTAQPGDGGLRQEVFELLAPAPFVQAHRQADAFKALSLAQLRPLIGCDVLWRFEAAEQTYSGKLQPGQCSAPVAPAGGVAVGAAQAGSAANTIATATSPQAWAADAYKLSDNQLLVDEHSRNAAGQRVQGNATETAARSRKVRYYEGWVWFKLAGPGAAADDKRTSFTAKFLLHNEGQRLQVLNADGTPSPYLLELAVLTYQNTRRPILKFGLVDRETQKTISYTWSAVSTPTLGMNLGWFQSGVTLKGQAPNFGF